jgi:hypothetical protein
MLPASFSQGVRLLSRYEQSGKLNFKRLLSGQFSGTVQPVLEIDSSHIVRDFRALDGNRQSRIAAETESKANDPACIRGDSGPEFVSRALDEWPHALDNRETVESEKYFQLGFRPKSCLFLQNSHLTQPWHDSTYVANLGD